MIPYVLGIDSGGTKYLVRAAALDGTILGEFRGNTCSHYYLGKEKAARETLNNLGNCLARFGGLAGRDIGRAACQDLRRYHAHRPAAARYVRT